MKLFFLSCSFLVALMVGKFVTAQPSNFIIVMTDDRGYPDKIKLLSKKWENWACEHELKNGLGKSSDFK